MTKIFKKWRWDEIPERVKRTMLDTTIQHHMSLDQLKEYQVKDEWVVAPKYRVPPEKLHEQSAILCDMNGALEYIPAGLTKPMEAFEERCPHIDRLDGKPHKPAPMVIRFHTHPYGVIFSGHDMRFFARGSYLKRSNMDPQFFCVGSGLGKKKYVMCLERTGTTHTFTPEDLPNGVGSYFPYSEDTAVDRAHTVETIDRSVHSFDTYPDTMSKVILEAHDKFFKTSGIFTVHYVKQGGGEDR